MRTPAPITSTNRRRVHRALAFGGSALMLAGAGLAAAAPAQAAAAPAQAAAAGAATDSLQVQRSCKTPGRSGTPNYAYYTSVTLKGSATGVSTYTFDSLTVQKNPALTQISPKSVTVPQKEDVTVTLQVTGSKNSADGPAVLKATLNQNGATSHPAGDITNFFPMQSADCRVTYPSTVEKAWPVTGPGVVSADLNGKALNVPAAAQGATTSVAAGHDGLQYALKADGSVVGWDHTGQTLSLPSDWNNLRSIDSNNDLYTGPYTLAVTADGTVVGTGDGGGRARTDLIGRTGMKTISTGFESTMGLTEAGAVIAGGWTDGGDAYVPEGYGLDHDVKQVIATYQGAIALKGDGTVVEWSQYSGVEPIPADVHDVTEIASVSTLGGYVVLRKDGSVIYWNNPNGVSQTLAIGATHIAVTEPNMWGQGAVVFVQKQDGTVTAIDVATRSTTPMPAMKDATSLQGGADAVVAAVPGA